ncbi:MAG: NADH-dependent [FeFe] hydrogenase, group A6 [Alphaproteobacteria bacterium]|nr:NADH-dependent [FeFe] hydrogenase, group A6 [Alphaproteobacteria bacterium]MCL2505189.1 NADH-dependent [FeFe] hydrogenase, group A6 [Alphaproteobacteria bacterium]
MEKVKLTINSIPLEVNKGTTLLEAAKKAGINIPTLCHHPDLVPTGNCRLCVVEQKGIPYLLASCTTQASEGMEIETNSPKVRESRKTVLELLLAEHGGNCISCHASGKCQLQSLSQEYFVQKGNLTDIACEETEIDDSSWSIVKDDSKCIRCMRCVRTCSELMGVGAIAGAHKGSEKGVETVVDKEMLCTVCINCGQCVNRCPTGALQEKRYINEVWEAINDPDKIVVVQTAPAVRVGLGEDLGLPAGEIVTGKMAAALKKLGFDVVLDTNFSADLTIMEEGHELLSRLGTALRDKGKAYFPMFTSCCPAWIKFAEHEYPEFLENISTCKSPQQMLGAMIKTYFAEKKKIDPSKIVSVSIMPCTAKKFEAGRPEMQSSGFQDVDYVLTTRELAHMIRQAGIKFEDLEEGTFDSPMGEGTGAALIFGATGGVMEAAIRTAYEVVTGRPVPFDNLNITPLRGTEGIRAASIKIEDPKPEFAFLDGVELNVAIVHGLANVRKVFEDIKAGVSPYHLIEVMACPNGCIGGGGQPTPTSPEIRKKRTAAIYEGEMKLPKRKSHENEEVQALYREFLKEPLGHKSHEYLHTSYKKRT